MAKLSQNDKTNGICKFENKGSRCGSAVKWWKNEKINDIKRTWVRSPPRATSLKKSLKTKFSTICRSTFWFSTSKQSIVHHVVCNSTYYGRCKTLEICHRLGLQSTYIFTYHVHTYGGLYQKKLSELGLFQDLYIDCTWKNMSGGQLVVHWCAPAGSNQHNPDDVEALLCVRVPAMLLSPTWRIPHLSFFWNSCSHFSAMKRISLTNLSQWMCFKCGAWLLYKPQMKQFHKQRKRCWGLMTH
jgi:hypothetical protein